MNNRLRYTCQRGDMKKAISSSRKSAISCLLLCCMGPVLAQDLEPRRWTPLPLGTHVLGVGYAYTEGDLGFDPVLRITDADTERHTLVVSHVNSFSIADKLLRFDAIVPWHNAEWDGQLNGEPASREVSGFSDPTFRLSMNLSGAPAVKPEEMKEYMKSHPVNTVAGAAIAVTVPLGDYDEDKLLNLGHNRYIVRPQIGMVHTRGPWSFELTGSIFFFSDNDDFYNDSKREQDPLYTVQTHLIHMFKPGTWGSVSAGYARGGRSEINGDRKDDETGNFLSALSMGFGVAKNQSMKITYLNGQTRRDTGVDFDTLMVGWLLRY